MPWNQTKPNQTMGRDKEEINQLAVFLGTIATPSTMSIKGLQDQRTKEHRNLYRYTSPYSREMTQIDGMCWETEKVEDPPAMKFASNLEFEKYAKKLRKANCSTQLLHWQHKNTKQKNMCKIQLGWQYGTRLKSHGAVTNWCTGRGWPVNCMTLISVRWWSNMPFQRQRKLHISLASYRKRLRGRGGVSISLRRSLIVI